MAGRRLAPGVFFSCVECDDWTWLCIDPSARACHTYRVTWHRRRPPLVVVLAVGCRLKRRFLRGTPFDPVNIHGRCKHSPDVGRGLLGPWARTQKGRPTRRWDVVARTASERNVAEACPRACVAPKISDCSLPSFALSSLRPPPPLLIALTVLPADCLLPVALVPLPSPLCSRILDRTVRSIVWPTPPAARLKPGELRTAPCPEGVPHRHGGAVLASGRGVVQLRRCLPEDRTRPQHAFRRGSGCGWVCGEAFGVGG